MIDRSSLANPLRWTLAAVLLGMVLSLGVGDQVLKFHVSRLVQLLPALGLLAWCFRPQPPAFFREPVISGRPGGATGPTPCGSWPSSPWRCSGSMWASGWR